MEWAAGHGVSGSSRKCPHGRLDTSRSGRGEQDHVGPQSPRCVGGMSEGSRPALSHGEHDVSTKILRSHPYDLTGITRVLVRKLGLNYLYPGWCTVYDMAEGSAAPIDERLVKLPVGIVIRVLRLVEGHEYATFDAVVAAALAAFVEGRSDRTEGRLGAEPSASRGTPPQSGASLTIKDRPPIHPTSPDDFPVVDPLPPKRLAWGLMGFTAPRYFPLKVGLRLAAGYISASGRRGIPVSQLPQLLGPLAVDWRTWLDRADKQSARPRGERLSTGLPAPGPDQWKSIDRFTEAYLAASYRDGRVIGSAAFLGYAGVFAEGGGSPTFGLTNAGISFASLENPVLDTSNVSYPPFNANEVDVILRDLAYRSRAETEHVLTYLSALRDNPGISRPRASASLRPFYERIWNPTALTPAIVESMRIAIHSRCQELGLARAVREGGSVSYHLTDAGREAAERLRALITSAQPATQLA